MTIEEAEKCMYKNKNVMQLDGTNSDYKIVELNTLNRSAIIVPRSLYGAIKHVKLSEIASDEVSLDSLVE